MLRLLSQTEVILPTEYKQVSQVSTDRKSAKHRSLCVACLFVLSCVSSCVAQTRTAQLTVSSTVNSSLGLIFRNNPSVGTNGFCPLSNPDTNNVGLDLGVASFTTGDNLACVGFFAVAGFYQVNSGFDVVVSEANSTSASYNLAAALSAAPPVNVIWLMNFTTLTTAFTTFQNNNTYGTRVTETLRVIVNQNVPPQNLLETIFVQATAN